MGPQPLKVMVWEAWKYLRSKQRRRGPCHRAIVFSCTQLTCAECTHTAQGRGKPERMTTMVHSAQRWAMGHRWLLLSLYFLLLSLYRCTLPTGQGQFQTTTMTQMLQSNESNEFLGYPAQISFIYTILWSTECMTASHPKKQCTYLNLKILSC